MNDKSFDWEIGDMVVSKTDKFNFTKGKLYEIFNGDCHDTFKDLFVIRNDLGQTIDISDCWFRPVHE